jgi:glutamate-ammonia-ligase adenylyltransferase
MPVHNDIHKQIVNASLKTPDPARSERNLLRLFELPIENEAFLTYLQDIARLFSVSQFLANFSVSYPEELLSALREMEIPITEELLQKRMREEKDEDAATDHSLFMSFIRQFKKRYLLRITLRDLSGRTDINSSMKELTLLAETLLSASLEFALWLATRRYGEPSDSSVTLVALGKLGAEELNYSSDLDIIAVYRNDRGQTSGVLGPTGVRVNRVSNHEYYCKVIELLNRTLSKQTEEGIAYRVDLRLRPQGQKGELALPLKAYETYYESWGRVWERMVLIRARPVSGDMGLGSDFAEIISPFLWRKTLDYTEIEEIRSLKKRIDSTFSRDDIKRGYGGIREAEFFVQTFQLIYGSENPALRTNNFSSAVEALISMKLIPEDELSTLKNNYLFLRRIEHYIQMKDDLQTHSLPSSKGEVESLARQMGFDSLEKFQSALRLRRMQIKNMYNSLLGTEEDVHAEALTLLERGLSAEELKEYLAFRKVKDLDAGVQCIWKIKEQMELFKTQKTRASLRRVIPEILEKALSSEKPDRALGGIESFINIFGLKDAYLTAFMEQKGLVDGMIKIFSLSTYLTRLFLSDPGSLDLLIEESLIRKTRRRMEHELRRRMERETDRLVALNEYKVAEEVRLGMFFLLNIIGIYNLLRYLSHLADVIIRLNLETINGAGNIVVIGLGKLGGREMTFGSDLDIIFLSESSEGIKTAEKIVKNLTKYTDKGMLYNVDVRLRPDGSKGALVKNIEGYRKYYLKNAHPWELQALLRARFIGGDMELGRFFFEMVRDVIQERGSGVRFCDVRDMRERIVKELSHEEEGVDIKLGPGGIEEIEFYIQWLQLNNAREFPEVVVQNTVTAIKILSKKGIISHRDEKCLLEAYEYYRKLETFLRLNEENLIRVGSEVAEIAGIFMGHRSADELFTNLEGLREMVSGLVGRHE